MHAGQWKWMPALFAPACVGFMLVWLAPASAQEVTAGWFRPKACPPAPCPAPVAPQTTEPPSATRPETPPMLAAPPSTELALDQRFAGLGGESVSLPNMLGDFLGATEERCVPFQQTTIVTQTTQKIVTVIIDGVPHRRVVTVTNHIPVTTTLESCYRVPAECHIFKISDDNSVRPQDRVFVDYNYYNNVLPTERLGSDISSMNVHREAIGIEKTFLDGATSVELFLPFNTLQIGGSSIPGSNGDFSDVGDLTVVLKAVIWEDRTAGYLFSGGLAVTVPTGPDSLGGVSLTSGCTHSTLLQPYLGYEFTRGNFYLHGFFALDIPTVSNDSLLMYNDVGVGYFALRNPDRDRILTAIVPTFEAHLTTPLSHEGAPTDPLFVPNVLNLTEGVTFEFWRRATLAVGVAEPVTGPKPFDVEAIAQLNVRF